MGDHHDGILFAKFKNQVFDARGRRRVEGRAALAQVHTRDEPHEMAFLSIARKEDRLPGVTALCHACRRVQPELAALLVRSVALDAVLGEDGLDVACEVDGLGSAETESDRSDGPECRDGQGREASAYR